MKPILILDAFIREKQEEEILEQVLDKMQLINQEVFLISNLPISEKIQKKINFFLYDKRDRLFEYEYTNVNKVYNWTDYGQFKVYDTIDNTQKHGLSVLINLNNCVRVLKELGYTHFFKMEYDVILGDNTIKKIKEIIETKKKGIFFQEWSENNMNLNVHFFFSEISFFIENFWLIDSEITYKNFLLEKMNSMNFLTMERFMWENLNQINKNDLEIRDDFHSIFQDSNWNLKQTKTGYDKKYQNCLSKIYVCKLIINGEITETKELVIFTKNLKHTPENRKIIAYFENGRTEEFFHLVDGIGSWTYNLVDDSLEKIIVFRDNVPLYEEYLTDLNNKIEFKTD